MLVNIKISRGVKLQIKGPVMCEQFQHMIEKADAGGDFVSSLSFDLKTNAYVGFFGRAIKRGLPHRVTFSRSPNPVNTSRRQASKRSLCSRIPTVMRTQPLHP